MDEDEAYPTENIKLFNCAICGRNFNSNTIRKHQTICQKTAQKKRRVFDSGKQRADGSDVIYEKTRDTKQVQIYGEKPYEEKQTKSNWRQKHNELIKAIKQAREVTVAIKTGAPLPVFQPSAVPSDYVQCSFCGRNFNQSAAQRHIPFCEQQHKRQKFNNSANNRVVQQAQPKSKQQIPQPGNRKQSSEQYGSGGGYGGYSASNGNLNSNGSSGGTRGGYGNNSFKSLSGGGLRKPIKYDSNLYNDRDSRDHEPNNGRVVYAIRNKSQTRGGGGGGGVGDRYDDQLLRTGRNNENSEKNSLARKRSGNNGYQSSPMNSRNASATRTLAKRSPSPSQNRQQGYAKTNAGNGGQKTSKFCTDCGTQYPVEWAKFCCLCGCRRY